MDQDKSIPKIREFEKSLITNASNELIGALTSLVETNYMNFTTVANIIIETIAKNKKILIVGNGGSAADAQHLATEFASSFMPEISRKSIAAIALTTNTSTLTAYSNDFNFDGIFARQIEGLGSKGDLLISISTSGESKNCLKAVEMAKNLEMGTVGLTRMNSSLHMSCDASIVFSNLSTQRMQELHVFSFHIICEFVEKILLEEGVI